MSIKYLIVFAVTLGSTQQVFAHAFADPYILPVPFWMYAYGASAALILSFLVIGWLSRAPVAYPAGIRSGMSLNGQLSLRISFSPLLSLLRACSVFLLCLTIVTGLFGTKNPYVNFNMTFFWIIFVLGLPYLTVVTGDIYRFLNPWRIACEWIEAWRPTAFPGRFESMLEKVAYCPALLLYMVFIWIELFLHTAPRSLSIVLLVYTIINLAGARLFGIESWFRYGEFFAVFLRLIGMMAPVTFDRHLDRDGTRRLTVRWRLPFIGLMEDRTYHSTLVLFILFMLSSTAYDGLHESSAWSRMFWAGIYPVIGPVFTAGSSQPYVVAANVYHHWQSFALLLSVFVYLLFYASCMKMTSVIARSQYSTAELSMRFALTLVPIAFVYHVTHYFTLLFSQGIQIIRQISDPFGYGWNLFGTAVANIEPVLIDANTVWHTQVALILVGHVVSVYLAHIEALRMFRNGYRAAVSQLPMLLLMLGLTAAGLWILSLPAQ